MDSQQATAHQLQTQRILRTVFMTMLLARLLFPFFSSPLDHLFSDPLRHWDNGRHFLSPDVMGADDPYLYQLWLFLLQQAAKSNQAVVLLGTGLLCAALPYGWYRALRELLPEGWSYGGAIAIGLMPGFVGIYGYFMNETLLLTLIGFAVWLSLRAMRLGTIPAFGFACALWLLAGFTRTVALPMGGCVMAYLWLAQPNKVTTAAVGAVLLAVIMVPAGQHARSQLHYFAPFGNIYLNEIYRDSGKESIVIDTGPHGIYQFTCPTYTNPEFYPWSFHTTDRTGNFSIRIDTSKGMADWIAEKQRAERANNFPFWQDMKENFLALCFSQSWPDNDIHAASNWLTVWSRWLWPPLILVVACGALARRFTGREWLLPVLGLGMFVFLALQHSAPMESRFRKPIDPLYIAAIVVMLHGWHRRRTGDRNA